MLILGTVKFTFRLDAINALLRNTKIQLDLNDLGGSILAVFKSSL